uniref:Uncharacterized protein n=1 Tax=Glossina pallidipes TaxID=7398 RepID=A0A1A9ZEH0_GLOPL
MSYPTACDNFMLKFTIDLDVFEDLQRDVAHLNELSNQFMDAIKISIHGRLTIGHKCWLLVYLRSTNLLWSWLALSACIKKESGYVLELCVLLLLLSTRALQTIELLEKTAIKRRQKQILQ